MITIFGDTDICEHENEILTKMRSKRFFDSFLAKLTIKELEHWDNFSSFQTEQWPQWLSFDFPFPFSNNPNYKEWLQNGETYIVTMCNRYHSQLAMPAILMFHFNCTRKELLFPYHVRQGYLGSRVPYREEPIWDENGVPTNEREYWEWDDKKIYYDNRHLNKEKAVWNVT